LFCSITMAIQYIDVAYSGQHQDNIKQVQWINVKSTSLLNRIRCPTKKFISILWIYINLWQTFNYAWNSMLFNESPSMHLFNIYPLRKRMKFKVNENLLSIYSSSLGVNFFECQIVFKILKSWRPMKLKLIGKIV
jgi:hypothetical protein